MAHRTKCLIRHSSQILPLDNLLLASRGYQYQGDHIIGSTAVLARHNTFQWLVSKMLARMHFQSAVDTWKIFPALDAIVISFPLTSQTVHPFQWMQIGYPSPQPLRHSADSRWVEEQTRDYGVYISLRANQWFACRALLSPRATSSCCLSLSSSKSNLWSLQKWPVAPESMINWVLVYSFPPSGENTCWSTSPTSSSELYRCFLVF